MFYRIRTVTKFILWGVSMTETSIAYCGLISDFCYPNGGCSCKSDNHCGKRLSPEGCFQYRCCTAKKLNGCWECPDAPCGIDMLAPDKIKMRAFVKCIKEDGIVTFIDYMNRNKENGIVYHRNSIFGDYDLATEQDVLELLRQGAVASSAMT